MSYNGSGTFIINTTGQPVVDGTVISSTVFNALTADLANGLTTALTKDGQSTVTNNIPLNGYKITNLGAGTVATDAVQLGQIQSGSFTALTVTGTDTYVASVTPTLAAYTAGNLFTFVVPNTNTGPATLNISSLGAKVLSRDGSTALAAGDLVAGSEVIVVYDGTRFQVLNSNSMTNLTVSGTATLSGGTANGIPYLNGSKVVTTGSNLTYNGTTTLAVNSAAAASSTLTLYGNGGSSGLVLQGGSDTNGYISTQNSLYLSTNSVSRGSINTTGNWVINAPTSGAALQVDRQVVLGNSALGSNSKWWAWDSPSNNVLNLYGRTDAGALSSVPGISLTKVGSTNQYLKSLVVNTVFDNSSTYKATFTVSTADVIAVNEITGTSFDYTVSNKGGNDGDDAGVYMAGSEFDGTYKVIPGRLNASSTGGVTPTLTNGAAQAISLFSVSAYPLELGTNQTARVSISSAGSVTVNAPTSGNALTLNTTGGASSALVITGVASQTGANISTSTPSGTTNFWRLGQPGVVNWDIQNVATTGAFKITNGSQVPFESSGTGNVTINAPTSGDTLALTNVAAGFAIKINDASGQGVTFRNATNTSGFDIGLLGGSGDATAYVFNRASSSLILGTAGNSRVQVNSTGTVTINAPTSGPALTVNGSASTPTVAVTFSATAMTVNCTLSNVFTTTFTANVTTAPTISNPQDGQTINWFITQDGTGSRTMTWPTSFKWPNGVAGVLSTAANSVDLMVATYRSATGFWYATLAKGFA